MLDTLQAALVLFASWENVLVLALGVAIGTFVGAVPGMRPPLHASPYGLQPMLYWYPSPPVSPQNAIYVHPGATTVLLKGAPINASMQDVLAFLEGTYEVRASRSSVLVSCKKLLAISHDKQIKEK